MKLNHNAGNVCESVMTRRLWNEKFRIGYTKDWDFTTVDGIMNTMFLLNPYTRKVRIAEHLGPWTVDIIAYAKLRYLSLDIESMHRHKIMGTQINIKVLSPILHRVVQEVSI
jgi:hypothetical protein